MPVAVISDVHGNLPALERVLHEIDEAGVELVVVAGDVANGPMPRETIERLMALGERARFVRGNGDRELVACFDGTPPDADRPDEVHHLIGWCAAQIDRRQRDFLAAFEDRAAIEVDGLGAVLCCHASPLADDDVFTARSPDELMRPLFAGVVQRVVTCGHTHMQFERHLDGIRIVNTGSVGMPYGDEPGAFWATLGPGVALRRTDYDYEAAARRVRATGYPTADRFAAGVIRPPSAADAYAYMERTQAPLRNRRAASA
jgi:putative phosphoesterase